MTPWVLAVLLGIVFAVAEYGWRRRARGGTTVLVALLRAVAVVIVAALLLDAPIGNARPIPPWVALDASLSWLRGGDSSSWKTARAAAEKAAAGSDSIFLFGDSVRLENAIATPGDRASLVGPAVERALAGGRPLVVVTDGDLDDPESLKLLPTGSRVQTIDRAARSDLALSSIELPRAVVSGDTIVVRASLTAGAAGAPAATLSVAVDGAVLASRRIDALAPYAERVDTVRLALRGAEGPAIVQAIATAPGDAERHNDTVSVAVDLSRAASAVFVSTAPDYDSRYALAVLRGAVSIPTRGYVRVAPGMWRVDGSLAPVTEQEVRTAFRDAPLAILHGDTAAFGAPRAVAQGPLALIVPSSADDGEWYASRVPPSPLSAPLSGMPWDSLPPIVTATDMPRGEWTALEAQRGREADRRAVVVGGERPHRVVIVGGSGFWRWRFRGGIAADAFGAFWGSIFDWLSEQRADRRAAVPDDRVFRAGEPIRWRRGSPADSLVTITITRRGARASADSLVLRYGADVHVVETPPLEPGVYEVSARGGRSLLAVNQSREWLPRAARVQSGGSGSAVLADTAPRLRAIGWSFAVALVLLCLEWVLRRRQGMR